MFWRRKSERIGGFIAAKGLTDWWLSAFSPQEREYIAGTFKPMGADPRQQVLVEGDFNTSTGTAASLLGGLSSWFRKPADRHLERRILLKAEELAAPGSFDLHLAYSNLIESYYQNRDSDPAALATAIRYCEKQIAMGPKAMREWRRQFPTGKTPSHVGFKQLAIISEKERNYAEAKRLSREAKRQGWAGDWDKRVERCEAKLAKR